MSRFANFLINRLDPKRNFLCVIGNYDFSYEADRMKENISNYFQTVLVDSSSPEPPITVDYVIPNHYYPGILRKAQDILKSSSASWLLFVASDVQIENYELIFEFFKSASMNQSIGIYTPSIKMGSRFSFSLQSQQMTSQIREVGIIEGFCFFVRRELFLEYSIPTSIQFGWGLDIELCNLAYARNYKVVVDDRVSVYHPKAKADHQIDTGLAQHESDILLGAKKKLWLEDLLTIMESKDGRINSSISLDLGSGNYPANPFKASYVIGLDRNNYDSENIFDIDLFKGKVPFRSRVFDYVTALDFIEHVPRVHQGLKLKFPFIDLLNEIWRVMKPGGIFYTLTPAYPHSYAFRDPTHVNIIAEDTFKNYFCEPDLWASMYGFKGRFDFLSQTWNDGKIETFMRCRK